MFLEVKKMSKIDSLIGPASHEELKKSIAICSQDPNVELKFTSGGCYTDGETIFLSPPPHDIDLTQRWIVLESTAIHEAWHILFRSNLNYLKAFIKKYELKHKEKIPSIGKIARDIVNIIEDGRIEHLGKKRFIGNKHSIDFSNSYWLGKRPSFKTLSKWKAYIEAILEISVTNGVKEKIKDEDLKKLIYVSSFYIYWAKNQKSCKATFESADKIMELLLDFFKFDEDYNPETPPPPNFSENNPKKNKKDDKKCEPPPLPSKLKKILDELRKKKKEEEDKEPKEPEDKDESNSESSKNKESDEENKNPHDSKGKNEEENKKNDTDTENTAKDPSEDKKEDNEGDGSSSDSKNGKKLSTDSKKEGENNSESSKNKESKTKDKSSSNLSENEEGSKSETSTGEKSNDDPTKSSTESINGETETGENIELADKELESAIIEDEFGELFDEMNTKNIEIPIVTSDEMNPINNKKISLTPLRIKIQDLTKRNIKLLREKELEKEINEYIREIERERIFDEVFKTETLDLGVKIKIPINSRQITRFNEIKKTINNLIHITINQFKSLFKIGTKTSNQLKSGRLDVKQMVKGIVLQDPHIFKKNQISDSRNQIAITLMIDQSGSMGGFKIYNAQLAAILFSEVLNSLGIEFSVYGWTDMGFGRTHRVSGSHRYGMSTTTRFPPGINHEVFTVYSYKDFNENYQEVKCRLADIQSISNNSDHNAIFFCREQLLKTKKRLKVLLVLSDGQPAAAVYGIIAKKKGRYHPGNVGLNLTRQAVETAREKRIHVLCISIDKAQNYQKQIYGENNFLMVDPENISELPHKVANVLKLLLRQAGVKI